MSEEYFRKFPQISYSGVATTDITRVVKVADSVLRNPVAYYPLESTPGERADSLAYFAYDDSSVDWAIYLTNGITDPYYDWYLDQDDFESLLVQKYGSIENSQKKISHFRVNWANSDESITVSFYESNLNRDLKKYYAPVFNAGAKVISYTRAKLDQTVSTNKIVKLDVTYSSNTLFSSGEIVDSTISGSTVGTSEVVYSNTTALVIKHVVGVVNTSVTMVGETTNATTSTITSVTDLSVNVPDLEAAFWEPVYFYEAEQDRNEKNKIINMLQPEYILPMAEALREKLAE